MYRAIAKNKRNTVFIILFFLAVVGGLGWLAAAVYGDVTIVIVTVAIATAYAAFQYFTADRQALAMSGAVELQGRADHPRLWRTVENLSIATGTPMPRVFVVSDPAPNAFATGRDPEHAVVAATTGLLEIMDDAELEGVMAHELGHVRNYDIRLSMIVFGLVVAVGFISDMFVRMAFFGRNNNNGNPIMMVVGLVAMLIAPLVASLVQLAVSRQREYLADATGAMTTRHPDALASALEKLEQYGRPMKRQNSSMAHLWIADPLKPGALSRLFATHPPIEERVKRLESMGGSF
ncbi:Heat shock protein. Metallo peptidase. MEROPS family M48B [Agromyces sp. CF514]|uniref:M48 family metalloprotease n=1 Tax=Agromyces sp. CF514 TaxID=1881031 RepID=UPI0008ED0EC1|nr:M48 family metalloprotease [Agromyces sp. CF514]SFR73872.1 Heat shock protein. Metallo peptidase. MEROPS family M48B [Agromyces sp. CF514]